MPQWFEELSGLLRIQSISAEAAHAADVAKAGEWVCELIRGAGGQSQLIDWHGQPLAIGELRASADAALAPTVLCYGHFDVQRRIRSSCGSRRRSSRRSEASTSTVAG